MFRRAFAFLSLAFLALAPGARARAAPALDVKPATADRVCGSPPPAGARWFYLGAPGEHSAAADARRALRAINDAFEGALPRDPACLRVEVLDDRGLATRYRRFGRGGPSGGVVGFHTPRLGADSTVYVTPQAGIPLAAVITHETLHALSHRFTNEASRRRLGHMVEGATDYFTRELAATSLGIARKDYSSGYLAYIRFYEVLVARLGADGQGLLGAAYLGDGYDTFEREVSTRLGVSLRDAARALEADDLATALQRISAERATPARRSPGSGL